MGKNRESINSTTAVKRLALGCTTRLGQMDSSSWRTMSQSSMVDASNVSRKLNRRPYYQPYIAGRWDDPALGGQWVTGGWGNKKPPYVDPDCSQAAIGVPSRDRTPRNMGGAGPVPHAGRVPHEGPSCYWGRVPTQRSPPGAARNRYPGVPATAAQVRAYPPRPQRPPNSAAHFPNLRGRLRHPTPQCYKAQPAKVTLWRNCDPVVQ